jgi:polysaccharide deacetylase 2 family uncharacterized protein YibQ
MREEPSRPAVSDPAALPQAGAGADTLPEAAEPPPMVEEEEALPGEVPAHSPLAPAPEEEASSTPAEPTAPTEPLLDSPAPDLPETAVPEAASPGTVAPVPDLSGPGDTAPATARTDPGAGAADQGTDTGPRHSVEIAAPPADPVTPTEPAPAELAPADPAPIVDSRPLARFAVPFDNPEGKPLFAIVLADDGGTGIDRAALAALPLPVTIALDPGAPGAAQFAVVYRNAGKEVAMLATGIPEGVKPADLEAILAAHAAVLPEAVAVVDLPDGGFQTDLARAAALMPLLKAQGRGLVTFDRGLNVGDQVARREAVPAALIFRQIDAEEESVPVMRRYLDRAVFKAAQDGHAVVFGAASPEVITALLEWSVEGRAGSVALAPLTALLSVPK